MNAPETSHFQNLGLAIKVLRELTGVHQARLARMASMGKSQLSKYETGKELPKLESLDKILVALKASPLALFLVVQFLDRIKCGSPPDLLCLGTPLGPLVSNTEEEAFTSFMRSVYGLFQAKAESRLQGVAHQPPGVNGGK
jgi:transcriptional regulator with XRE-family HTH domain